MNIRLNKFISQCGELSRRSADEAIAAGRVKVNGIKALTGQVIDPDKDEILLDNRNLSKSDIIYLAAYKPKYMLTTMKDPMGRSCIKDIIPDRYKGVFPAGRLDFDAEGLLILTNDGEMANAIHHPSRNMAKVYIVGLKPCAESSSLLKMAEGVEIEGKITRRALVERIKDINDMTIVRITLRQGLKNQIKKMAEAVGLSVASIKRIAVGPVKIDNMKPGEIRQLTLSEVTALKNLQKKHNVA